MTIENLKKELENLSIPSRLYSINKIPINSDELCIYFNGRDWEVFYYERNDKVNLKYFENENDACEHFLSIIKTWLPLPKTYRELNK